MTLNLMLGVASGVLHPAQGCKILVVTIIIPRRTSEIWAAHLMVSLTMTDTPAHGLPVHAGVRAGVVGVLTNDQAVLI